MGRLRAEVRLFVQPTFEEKTFLVSATTNLMLDLRHHFTFEELDLVFLHLMEKLVPGKV